MTRMQINVNVLINYIHKWLEFSGRSVFYEFSKVVKMLAQQSTHRLSAVCDKGSVPSIIH